MPFEFIDDKPAGKAGGRFEFLDEPAAAPAQPQAAPGIGDKLKAAREAGNTLLSTPIGLVGGALGGLSGAGEGLGNLITGRGTAEQALELIKQRAAGGMSRFMEKSLPQSELGQMYHGKATQALESLSALGPAGSAAALAGVPAAGAAAARAARPAMQAVKGALPGLPESPIGRVTGSRLNQALTDMRGKYGGAQEELGLRAETQSLARVDQVREQANKARAQGLDALRVIRGQEIANAQTVEQAGKAAESAGAASLRGRLAAPKSIEETFTKVKDALGGALSKATKSRADAAEKAYSAARQVALDAEAGGNGFAHHPEGQALLSELRAMRQPGESGYADLTKEQAAAVDKLIGAIEGEQVTTTAPVGSGRVTAGMTRAVTTQKTAPASMKVLTNELRELRKVNERSSPVEGYGALGVEFSRDLAGMMSRRMYEWNPAYAAADAEYSALSQGLNRFKTERMMSATRGEKFDFKEFAASPDEFARFFKTGEGVRDLKAALGDDALVKQVGKEWAAHELRTVKGAGKVEEWMAKNQDWLRESGALPDVQAYAQDLAGHEAGLAKATSAGEARAGTLKKAAGLQQQNIASIGATAERDMAQIAKTLEGHKDAAKAVSDLINFETPRNIASKFDKNVLPKLRETGLMSEEQLSALQAEVRKVNQMADDQRKARWVAAKIAAALGVAGYISTSTSGPR